MANTLSITIKTLAFMLVSALLISCGNSEPKPVENTKGAAITESTDDTGNDDSEFSTVDAVALQQVVMTPSTRVNGQAIDRTVAQNALNFNASGEFLIPKDPGGEFKGNVTVAFNVTDPDGLERVFLKFENSDTTLVVCEAETCTNPFTKMVNGIKPQLFGLDSGDHTLELWADDTLENRALIASYSLNWQNKLITGLSILPDENAQTLTVSWTPHPDVLRYNVYLANEPGIIGSNLLELEGNDARLSLTETNAVFTDKALDLNYFVRVTGIDGTGESAFSDEVFLIAGNPTQAPSAVNDSFTTDEDTSLAGNVLANDNFSSNDEVSVSSELVTSPTNGTLNITADGNFTYTPNSNFNGQDQFSYQIENSSGLTSQANVSITVTAQNDAPVATDDIFVSDTFPFTTADITVLSNDSDIDGDELSVTINVSQLPKFGTVILSSTGAIEYQPNDDFVNYDVFGYVVTDASGATHNATVDIRTSDFNGYPPIAVADSYNVTEDTLLVVNADSGVTVNDFDDDDPSLNQVSISLLQTSQHGELTFLDDGGFSYQPNANFDGTDSFTYALTDELANTTSTTVSLNIASQNDAPVAASDNYKVANDGPNTIHASFGLLSNDSDIDNTNLTVNLDSVTQPSHGALSVAADGSFEYTPQTDFVGTDTFTYQATDGSANSAATTVTLNVVNVIADTDDLTPITINLADISANIIGNATLLSVAALNGTIDFTAGDTSFVYNPIIGGDEIDTLQLTFEFNGNQFQMLINIRVEATNTAPQITSADSGTFDENLAVGTNIFQVTATDNESTTSELTFALTDDSGNFTIAQQTGAITLLNEIDYEALPLDQTLGLKVFPITVTVTDPEGAVDEQSISLSVNDLNEAPLLVADEAVVTNYSQVTIDVLANDSDPDNLDNTENDTPDTLTILSAEATNGTVSIEVVDDKQQLIYQPNHNITSDTITYVVADQLDAQSLSTVAVTVQPLALAGEHDINNDANTDLTVTYQAEQNLWQFDAGSQVTTVFEVINNKLYPIELSQDGSISFTAFVDQNSHQYGLVIQGQLHYISIPILDVEAAIEIQFDGLSLPLTPVATDVVGAYITSALTLSENNIIKRLAVNPGAEEGALIAFDYLDGQGSGTYQHHDAAQTFGWTLSDSAIEITLDNSVTDVYFESVDNLYYNGIIDDATYNNYLEQDLDGLTEVEVSVSMPSISLTITDNQYLYIEVSQQVDATYVLPAELGGTSVTITEVGEPIRLYRQEQIGSYAFSAVSGEYAVPVFSADEDRYQLSATFATFNSDGSGTLSDSGESFTWSITSEGQLQLSIIDGPTYTYTKLTDETLANEVHVVSTMDTVTLSSLGYFAAVQGISDAEITSLITGKSLTHGQSTSQISSYDDNQQLQATHLLTYLWGEETALNAPVGSVLSMGLISDEFDYKLMQVAGSVANQAIDFSTYFDFEQNAQFCDPDTSTSCFIGFNHQLEVLAYDADNQRIWVVETQTEPYFDGDTQGNSEPNYYQRAKQVTYYTLADTVALTDDAFTVNEDEIANGLDVLTNDTAANAPAIIAASPYFGMLAITENGQLDYAAIMDFNGEDQIQYLVLDANNQLGVATVAITVTPVNDAPIANADNAVVLEGQSSEIVPLDNDFDIDQDNLTINAVSALYGTVSLSGSDTILYTPAENISEDTLTYSVSDGELISSDATINVQINPRPLVGEHDVNLDNVIDLTISPSDDDNAWLVATNNISTLFKIENGMHYPLHRDLTGQFEFLLPYDSSDAELGAVINNQLHVMQFAQLSSNPILLVDRVGEPLLANFDQLGDNFELVMAFATATDAIEQDNIDINPRFWSGTIYQFDRTNMTGSVTDASGQRPFTWSAIGSQLTLSFADETFTSQMLSASDLLNQGIISQAEFDAYAETNDLYNPDFVVSSGTSQETLQIQQHNGVFYAVDSVSINRQIFAATADFTGNTLDTTSEPTTLRLYHRENLAVYNMPELNGTTWYGVQFETIDQSPVRRHYPIDFNNDGSTGNIAALSMAINWQINSENQLLFSNADNSRSYTFTPLSAQGNQQVVLVEAQHNDDGSNYATLAFIAKDSDFTSSEVQGFVTDKMLLSAFTEKLTSSYDENGLLLADNIFSYQLTSNVEFDSPDDQYRAERDFFFLDQDNIHVTENNWLWSEANGTITLNAYYDINAGSYAICDPEVSPESCTIFRVRNWKVIDINYDEGAIWVEESEQIIEQLPWYTEDQQTVLRENIPARINRYYINSPLQLQDDSATTVEETSLNNIDVLANDLDSEGVTGSVRLIAASADSGTISYADGLLNYTPNTDFNGVDTIRYAAADLQNNYDIGYLFITVTNLNDGPTIESEPPTQATEGQTFDYFIAVNDPDDNAYNGDLTFTLTQGPTGMTIDSNGHLTWLADGSSSVDVSFTVADGGENGAQPTSQSFTINIESNPLLEDLTFTDSVVESCIANQYDITTTRRLDVQHFNCDNIGSLVDLVQFQNLYHLNLNNATDWSELANLDLHGFAVHNGTNLTDWTLLAAHQNLTSLTLYGVTLADWSFLANLDLHYLNLEASNFADLNQISHMADLQTLLLSDSDVVDWNLLTDFSLFEFSAANTNFNDLTLIAHMANLGLLSLSNLTITDWSIVSNFNLQHFDAIGSNFSDMNLLANMSQMYSLRVDNTSVSDFSSLANMSLHSLSLDNTLFDDSHTGYLANSNATLYDFNFNGTAVTDFSFLNALSNLQHLQANISGTSAVANTILLGLHDAGVYINSAEDGDFSGVFDFLEIGFPPNILLEDIVFTDSTVAACIANHYDITTARRSDVHYINCDNIDSLADYVQFPYLNHIDLSNANDWSDLANLDLQSFAIHNNTNFTDWSLLAANQNLHSLTLYGLTLADWSFLANFDLLYLNLESSNFADLNDISHMTNLQTLLLSDTDVTDWSTLSAFNLLSFSAGHTNFNDLSLIAHMTGMGALTLTNLTFADWSVLSNFDLHHFDANNTNFSDLSLLANMAQMNTLYLSNTLGTDFSALSNMSLHSLWVDNTAFSDTDTGYLTASNATLYELNFNGTAVTEFSFLNELTNLQHLHANITGTTTAANTILLGLHDAGIYINSAEDSDFSGVFDFLEIGLPANVLLEDIVFTDNVVETCIANQFDVTTARLLDVYYLSCDNIDTLVDLVQFRNLQTLELPNANDWSELANLDLQGFSVHNNTNLTDWSLLAANPNLHSLTLYGLTLADWSFLTNFDLLYLNLDASNFADISQISHMTELQTLLLSGTDVTDWSGLSAFNLYNFSASDTNFTDLTLVSHMTNLVGLNLINLTISDWSSVSNFDLQQFNVQGSTFSDMSLLTNMSQMTSLNVSYTGASDFSVIASMALQNLNVGFTGFADTDTSYLTNSNASLYDFIFNDTAVTDFSFLNDLTNLQYLQARISGTTPAANAILLGLYNAGVYVQNAEDSDYNGVWDFLEDFDGDGQINSVDDDDDGDGTLDGSDAYPLDASRDQPEDLATHVDYSAYEVTSAFTDGHSYWQLDTSVSTTNGDSLRSGLIEPAQHTVLETTVDGGPDGALMTFDWRVSSETNYDLLSFYVDNVLITSISGEQDWAEVQHVLTEGTHNIQWIYSKNSGVTTSGDDAGWIDNLNVSQYDINDAPVINSSSINGGTVSLSENISSVLTVVATDEENDGISYTLSGADASLLTIDGSGALTFNTPPNFDVPSDANNDNDYEVAITATDDNAAPASTTESVLVTVINVEEAPVFTSTTTLGFDENTATVTTVSATDDDGNNITYSLSGVDSSWFTINANTGELTFTGSADYEVPADTDYNNVYEIDITVTDDSGSALSSTASFQIALNDVNEAPQISNATSGSVNENQTSLITISAYDDDTGDLISYALSGDDASLLNINTSGVVSFNVAPDFETPLDADNDGTYEFSVTVTDDDATPLSSTTNFSYIIDDINEAAVFTSSNTINIAENIETVMVVAAADPESNAITYSLTGSGPDDSLVQINSNTGALSFVAAPNFEGTEDSDNNNIFDVEVAATEAGGSLVTTQSISITLTDAAENVEWVLDSSFNGGGVQSFNTFAESYSEELVDAVQDTSGNKYLLLNAGDNISIIVAKLNASGHYDPSFGFNGIKFINPIALADTNVTSFSDTPTSLRANDIKLDSSGSIYIGGYQTVSAVTEAIVIKLESDGQLDTNFSSDGKYTLTSTYPPSYTTDLLLHSDGVTLYALAKSQNMQMGNPNSLAMESFNMNNAGNPLSILLDSIAIGAIGLAENNNGNVITVINEADNIKLVEYNTAMQQQASLTIDATVEQALCTNNSNQDYAVTVYQPNLSTIIVGGSSDCFVLNEQDAFIAKVNADSLTLDDTFDLDGVAVLDVDGLGDDDPVISVSQDNNGNITFVTKTALGGGDAYGLQLNQFTSAGVLSSLNSNINSEELSLASGSISAINAVVLQDITDVDGKFTLISSRESDYPNSTELETYLVEFDPTVDTDISAKITSDSLVYDFSMVDTLGVYGATLSSDGHIYTMSSRVNDQGGFSPGYTLSKHSASTGLAATNFANNNYTAAMHRNGNDTGYLLQIAAGVHELSDNSLLAVIGYSDDNTLTYQVKLERFDANGTSLATVTTTIDNSIDTIDSFYDPALNILVVYGGILDSSNELIDSFIAKYDVSVPSNITEDYYLTFDTFGVSDDDYLTGAVVLSDGSVVAVGTAIPNGSFNYDSFLINVQPNGSLLTTFDGDADGNHALEAPISTSNDEKTTKLVKLSDDSLIFATNISNLGDTFLTKLTSVGGGVYTIDSAFDTLLDDGAGDDGDNYIQLDAGDITAGGGNPSYNTYDLTVDNADNLYIVGHIGVTNDYGFVAKLNGTNGTYDALFGAITYPGFFVPAGRADCDNLSATVITDICDVTVFERIHIDAAGDIFIHGKGNGPDGKDNTVILKFNESADDVQTSYSLFYPGA